MLARSHEAMEVAKWFWRGDARGGSQNTWVEYDAETSARLEAAHKSGQPRVDVDPKRFVDFGTAPLDVGGVPQGRIAQRLKADPGRYRPVLRKARAG